MKPLLSFLSLLISLVIILVGCQAKENLTNKQQVQQPGLILATEDDPRQGYPTKLSEFVFDLDSDGTDEIIELFTAAGRHEDGKMLWDDGQKWLLVVQDGSKFYPLFAQYVQLGNVYFNVGKHDEKETPVVTVILSTGAGLQLINYVYDPNEQGYREKPVYKSPITNWFFSSIPSYQ